MTPEATNDRELSASIGRHGAYLWETKRILEAYLETKSYEAVREAVVEDNLLRKGSERYREDILAEIAGRYRIDKESYTETPLLRTFKRPIADSIQNWILYYEFSQDPLVALITRDFLFPQFHEGALTIQKEDVLEFLDQIKSDHPVIGSWSENTKLSVAEHYLAAMKNFGLLEGNTQKEFSYVYAPDELVLYVLYSLFEQDMTTAKEVVQRPDWKLLLMTHEDVRDRLQGLSPTYVNYEKRGSVERLDPKYESLMECIDEF